MENPKVLALRLHCREGDRAVRIAQILARPKGYDEPHIIPLPRYRIPQPAREKPTPAQLRVISAISHGMNLKETAEILGISWETAKTHIRNAKLRTVAKTTAHLVAICLRNEWIP